MKYKILALDLDGTLLDSNLDISQKAKNKIEEITKKEVKIILCTGRRYSTVLPYMENLNFSDDAIINNGIIIKNIKTKKTIYSNYLSSDTYQKVISFLKNIKLPLLVLVDEYPDYEVCIDVDKDANEYHMEYVEENRKMCRVVDSLNNLPAEKIIVCSILYKYEALRKIEFSLIQELNEYVNCFTIRNVKYKGSSMEVFAKGASKWNALRFLARKYAVQPNEIIAIGDDVNDIEMIRNAGLGIAMQNAFNEVKEVADYVTASRDENGVVKAIDKFLK